MRLVPALCVLGSIVSMSLLLAARQDQRVSSDERAAMVMGFDQEVTAHHFSLFTDGGAVEVIVKNP